MTEQTFNQITSAIAQIEKNRKGAGQNGDVIAHGALCSLLTTITLEKGNKQLTPEEYQALHQKLQEKIANI